jgi:glycosyltransferase involved in cell wall biosynthesis
MTTGVFDLEAFHRLALPKRVLKRWGAKLSDLNIVISRDEEKSLAASLGVKHKPIHYSPLAIDSAVYTPAAPGDGTGEPFTILNITWQRASNIRRKMVPDLLEAFAKLAHERKDCRLILAGPPEDGGPLLQARARELGIESRVEFPGEVSREKKIELLQRCSLYCQVSHYEGFGVAIAEAMACGAPVLVGRVGAVPEVVGDSGTYVRETSVEGILDGLKRCLAGRAELRAKAEQGIRRIRETFSVERRRQDLKKFIAELTC